MRGSFVVNFLLHTKPGCRETGSPAGPPPAPQCTRASETLEMRAPGEVPFQWQYLGEAAARSRLFRTEFGSSEKKKLPRLRAGLDALELGRSVLPTHRRGTARDRAHGSRSAPPASRTDAGTRPHRDHPPLSVVVVPDIALLCSASSPSATSPPRLRTRRFATDERAVRAREMSRASHTAQTHTISEAGPSS